VLPTSAKFYLPDYLKNSAAGEQIRPHTLSSIEAGLIHVSKHSEGMFKGKKSGNSVDFIVFSSMYLRFSVQTTLQKSSAPFLLFFANLQKIRPRIFFDMENFHFKLMDRFLAAES
jgi:hypothetical protein